MSMILSKGTGMFILLLFLLCNPHETQGMDECKSRFEWRCNDVCTELIFVATVATGNPKHFFVSALWFQSTMRNSMNFLSKFHTSSVISFTDGVN